MPGKIKPLKFTIEQLYDFETEEKVTQVNPGKIEQKIKLKLPKEIMGIIEEGFILRRKK
ncbi:MAG: hypothetical protein FWF46_07095 [Oscillospiraceae bacterium]|nr:hypothetical protein [Oscillospiraceae bacterium]